MSQAEDDVQENKTPTDNQENSLEEDENLQQLALSLQNVMPIRSLPKQEYLQATVIPILLEGMSWIIKERPEDPVENLAMFLIKNNPNTPELHQTIELTELE